MPPLPRPADSGAITAATHARRSFNNTFLSYAHRRSGSRSALFRWAAVWFFLSLHHFPRAQAAPQCADVAKNAVANLVAPGTSWMCCSATAVSCVPWDQNSVCPGDHPVYAQCVNAVGRKACGVNEYGGISTDQGAPCGRFQGAAADSAVHSVQGNGKTSVDINMAGKSVLGQWPLLAYENYLSLCCESDACRMVDPVMYINKNNCTDGERILKCAGDATNGLCSIWDGDVDSGQYFLVNANPPTNPGGPPITAVTTPLRRPSSTSPAPSETGFSPPTGDPSSTTGGPAAASVPPQSSPPPASPSPSPAPLAAVAPVWAIALIAGLGGMLVFAALVFLWHRGMCGLNPKYRARTIDPFISPPPSSTLPGYAPPRRSPSGLLPPQYSAWDTSEGKRMSRSRRYGF